MIVNCCLANQNTFLLRAVRIMPAIIFRCVRALNGALNRILKSNPLCELHLCRCDTSRLPGRSLKRLCGMTARKSAVASSEHSSYRARCFFFSFVSADNRKRIAPWYEKVTRSLLDLFFSSCTHYTAHIVSVLFFSLHIATIFLLCLLKIKMCRKVQTLEENNRPRRRIGVGEEEHTRVNWKSVYFSRC